MFKRIYLLGAIIVSVVIPFLVVKTVVVPVQEIPVLEFQNSMAQQEVTQVATETGFAIDWFYVALGLYLLGVCIMLFRFTKNLIAFQIQKNDVVSSYASYLLILRGEVTVPHSFWNRIFVSKKQYEQDLIPTVVLEHEKTHLDQKHSLDVLFVELLLVLFWFNPVLYMLRYAIKLNHEFLADQAVLKTGISTKDYQELILNHATSQYQHAMANTFNFPFIKKRFTIMKTQTSQRSLLLRSLVLVPVIALLIISCGREETEFKPMEKGIKFTKEIPTNTKIIVLNDAKNTGSITVDEEVLTYSIAGDYVKFFNAKGAIVDIENQGYKVLKDDGSLPSPPPPISALDYINIHKDKLNFYLGEYPITADIAIAIIEKNGQNGIEISPDKNGVNSIKIKLTEANKVALPPPPPLVKSAKASGNKMHGTMIIAGKKHYFESDDGKITVKDEFGNIQDVDLNARNIDEITVFGKKGENEIKGQPKNTSELTKIAYVNKNAVASLKPDISNLSIDEQKQFKLRNTFIYASEQTDGNVTYFTDNNLVSSTNARAFLKDNPYANVSLKQNDDNLTELHFNRSSNKMTDTQLQTIYTELFELTKNTMNKGGSFVIIKEK
jgi:hypothetical protein